MVSILSNIMVLVIFWVTWASTGDLAIYGAFIISCQIDRMLLVCSSNSTRPMVLGAVAMTVAMVHSVEKDFWMQHSVTVARLWMWGKALESTHGYSYRF